MRTQGVSRMDKWGTCQVEEEKRKVESRGHLQALVRNVHFIIVKDAQLCCVGIRIEGFEAKCFEYPHKDCETHLPRWLLKYN